MDNGIEGVLEIEHPLDEHNLVSQKDIGRKVGVMWSDSAKTQTDRVTHMCSQIQ